MKFVKHKGSTAAKLLPSEFTNLKQSHLERIKEAVLSNNNIQMVINVDQTAISLVPSLSCTMDERGKNKIVIKGVEDKQVITALLDDTLSGVLMPPQLLYEGKTDRCYPHVNFPPDWDIFHTDNHWQKHHYSASTY